MLRYPSWRCRCSSCWCLKPTDDQLTLLQRVQNVRIDISPVYVLFSIAKRQCSEESGQWKRFDRKKRASERELSVVYSKMTRVPCVLGRDWLITGMDFTVGRFQISTSSFSSRSFGLVKPFRWRRPAPCNITRIFCRLETARVRMMSRRQKIPTATTKVMIVHSDSDFSCLCFLWCREVLLTTGLPVGATDDWRLVAAPGGIVLRWYSARAWAELFFVKMYGYLSDGHDRVSLMCQAVCLAPTGSNMLFQSDSAACAWPLPKIEQKCIILHVFVVHTTEMETIWSEVAEINCMIRLAGNLGVHHKWLVNNGEIFTTIITIWVR